ncbi:N-acetyl-gamma-glutamyl-phosphate reductase [Roseivirga pacifica]|uniref:N-acetyl-gamma-glutamyl-phosphate reductase n=1 Tax=Roseivirga pacifica TaxID=1267423 RepID=UPI002094FCF3|nr:N-acetyl-gamma-glutamyl-phosphate reductase [Roseivirga pacifica]MCO6358718.1 N-acetyl-gamma-glutamyl-phosphate reductase [Roseivirga pacifica]MCO6365646.1 N-acetyl-gamma-glutamyl-phosphate reductase [Roseivirga pacifica]MCO6371624.1 N-acetyl-gamma-glutamyl-phosphate reductase [Roseivirga pacifica]MCO6376265.1 N-acetyl-gamma-glutamyl-phosphate reductase [Roseivirga pacifica]MCO6379002.1 N-acetyl-gamma-glutamyl-phosphate reductase [Roseivirga pacifica]
MIKAGIIGGAGYTGGELIRLLLNHPQVELTQIISNSQAGLPVNQVHQDLLGETDICFSKELDKTVDVVFLCMGHGASSKFFEENELPENTKVIDLSHDFRLDPEKVYGLPELNKEAIKSANFIANPGCFATAIELALLPLAHNGMLKEVHVSGITGSTGAGMSPSETTHFSWRDSNISTYKAFTHQHLDEIRQTLMVYQPWFEQPINFVPYRGNFTRGIMVTAYQYCEWPLEEAVRVYKECYEDHPFTFVTDNGLDLKQVVNTNKCVIQLEMHNGYLMVQSVIDNLLKGASGQAVQNMNLMFGFDEDEGLKLKASRF